MIKIVQKENPVLRQKAKKVSREMFGTKELEKILNDMSKAMSSQDDAVAIAAPQIGVPYRIFLISGHVFEMIYKDAGVLDDEVSGQIKDMVFINPEIIKLSKEKDIMEEGCLSVRYLYGKTKRSKKATVVAFDEKGKQFELSGTGLLAQIFQHEYDHLNGVLFIDHAFDVQDIPPKK